MFEPETPEFESLLKNDGDFRRLYQHHRELDSKVRDAELGVLPMDEVTLLNMKKEKLQAKDRLTVMWQELSAGA